MKINLEFVGNCALQFVIGALASGVVAGVVYFLAGDTIKREISHDVSASVINKLGVDWPHTAEIQNISKKLSECVNVAFNCSICNSPGSDVIIPLHNYPRSGTSGGIFPPRPSLPSISE